MNKWKRKYKTAYLNSLYQLPISFVFFGIIAFYSDKWLMPDAPKWLSNEIINQGYIFINFKMLIVAFAIAFTVAAFLSLIAYLSIRNYYKD